MGLRETLNEKPIIIRTFAFACVVIAIVLVWRSGSDDAPDSVKRRSEIVTIRDTETGDEWTMNRGQFERLLLLQDGEIDPKGGIPSKFSDGRPTGVLIDTRDWTETVTRINAMKEQIGSGG